MAPTVLITGASQGIGRATALLFAQNGYNIVLAARHSEPLDAVVQELQMAGHSALAIPTDVKDFTQVGNLVEKALAVYSNIDVLVNNAGIYISGPVDQFSLEDWHQAIDTNLWGYIHTVHALLPHFIGRGSGTIVNLGSIGSKVAVPYLVPYITSKFAVTGFTQALEAELTPKGIHVCGIYPNLINSNFLERAIFRGRDEKDAQKRKQQIEQILKVPAVEKPEDVAQAIWNAVKHKRNEVVVGSANLSVLMNTVLPGLMQRLSRIVFKHRD